MSNSRAWAPAETSGDRGCIPSEQQVRRGDPVDVDQVVELIGNAFVPELIVPPQRSDVAESHPVDPFEGQGLLLAHLPQVEDKDRLAKLVQQVFERAGWGRLHVVLQLLRVGTVIEQRPR